MSNYVKPQNPLYNETNDTFIYPLTTVDQIITNDGKRLNADYVNIDLNNANKSDNMIFADKLPKAGFIYPLASVNVPEGFLLCDGAAYARAEYPELFAAIGTLYGEGDGSTTFNVPNLQTRVPVGAGEGYGLGGTGGEETVKLQTSNLPDSAVIFTTSDNEKSGGHWSTGTWMSHGQGYVALPLNQSTLAKGIPHNNMQPYTIVNYIIATGKDTGVSVADIVLGAQAIPLGVEYGGTGATNAATARDNLEITPENIGAMKMEVLWENERPSEAFIAQNISLDLTEYSTIKVLCSGTGIHEIPVNGSNYQMCYPLNANTYRTISATNEYVNFSDCEQITTYGTWARSVDNTLIRPHKIYGIKGGVL